jgi:YggT family protein
MISALVMTLVQVLELYKWVIIISALISWVNPDPTNPIVEFLRRVTEPAYAFVRRYIPTVIGGIDLSPIVILFAIMFVQQLLMNLAY